MLSFKHNNNNKTLFFLELEKQGETLKEEHIIFFKYTGKQSKYKEATDFYNDVPASKDYDTAEKVRDESISKNYKIVNKMNNHIEPKEELDKILKEARSKKGYPMTYDEYEKRVIELYLKIGGDDKEWKKRQKNVLEELEYTNSPIIPAEYLTACHKLDEQNYNRFTDDGLLRYPVRILDLLT